MSKSISTQLSRPTFRSSRQVIIIDSIITYSIFGPHPQSYPPRRQGRFHNVQVLDPAFNPTTFNSAEIYAQFEHAKGNLDFANVAGYMQQTSAIANKLYRLFDILKERGAREVISWCLAAYAMVINPKAAVKLSTRRLGPERQRGFAIHATRTIKEGDYINELIGMLPQDNEYHQTGLSEIGTSSAHSQQSDQKRVMFGPIRFVNHLCEEFNAEYIAWTGRSAMTVMALRDIEAGEEITVDYGDDFWEQECPCNVCHRKKEKAAHEQEKAVREEEKALKDAKRVEKKAAKKQKRYKKEKALKAKARAMSSGQ